MKRIKIIKTQEEYTEAVNLLTGLLETSPAPGSANADKIELLGHLITEYESTNFVIDLPDPIEAIKFRMDQMNLTPNDMIEYFGSKSRVSEILSRKRPLTLGMIKSLEKNLNIPAKVLLQETTPSTGGNIQIAWERLPVKELQKRGYIASDFLDKVGLRNQLESFIGVMPQREMSAVLMRKTEYIRSSIEFNRYALLAWTTAVIKKADNKKPAKAFDPATVDATFAKSLVKLSIQENWSEKLQKALEDKGIVFVIERHFEKTYIDGAVLRLNDRNPIIAMTLRHDRLDNFWFTLMHELAHLILHRNQSIDFLYDDLESTSVEKIEQEADALAGEVLIPASKWANSTARIIPSPAAAGSLAAELGIHIAIVAGKMRHENSRYQYLTKIIQESKVREFFPEFN